MSGSLLLLNRVTLLLLALFAAQAILGFGEVSLVGWVGERVVADLRKSLYGHLHAMPLRFFGSTRIGELLSRLGNDVNDHPERRDRHLCSACYPTRSC